MLRWLIAALIATYGTFAVGADADASALELESDVSAEPPAAAKPTTRTFLEAGLGWADWRYGDEDRSPARLAVDGRYAARLHPALAATLSARVDWSDPPDPRIGSTVFSLREAYVGWQDESASTIAEVGRITLRESPGYGYNPTDFFRDNSLRTFSAVDPGTLRDYRLGSVMLRAQRLWTGGSMAVVYSPRLSGEGPSEKSWSFDWGATNGTGRGQVSASFAPSEKINVEGLVYKESGSNARLGASFSALASDALVIYGEATYSEELPLIERALAVPADPVSRPRFNAGLTYTTASRFSLIAEYQYNGFALDKDEWNAVRDAGGNAALGAYYAQAAALQDNAARSAVFFYAVQRDLGTKNLDLTALLKVNLTDQSRLVWLDLTYRLARFDLSLRALGSGGPSGSEFGLAPVRYSVGAVVIAYF